MKKNRERITKFEINFSKVVHLLEETEKKRREKKIFLQQNTKEKV